MNATDRTYNVTKQDQPLTFEMIHLASVTSTMDSAAEHYKEGSLPPFAIVAEEQTQGRGRRGRSWISQKGNIFVTYVTICPKRNMTYMSFVSSLSVYEALEYHRDIHNKEQELKKKDVEPFLSLKWPNDVLLRGKKVAGILINVIESYQDHAILAIGMGINTHHKPDTVTYPTTCLVEEGYEDVFNANMVALIGERLGYNIKLLNNQGWSFIKERWFQHCYHTSVRIVQGGIVFHGKVTALDDRGHLVLTLANGSTKSFATGDVFL